MPAALTAPVAQTSPPQSTPKDEKADQATEIPAPSSKSVVETRGMVIQEQGAPKVAIPAQIRHEEWQTSGHPKEAVVMRCIPSGAGAVQQQRSIPCEDDGFEEDQLPGESAAVLHTTAMKLLLGDHSLI